MRQAEQTLYLCIGHVKKGKKLAVVEAKWSACLPSTLTIQVQIPLKYTIFL